MRILVTGSRDWEDEALIARALAYAVLGQINQHPRLWLVPSREWVTIVHGDCPTGADRIADKYATFRRWPIERHPADWDTYGRSAGPIRNAHMVSLSADLCLAFISDCTSPRCDKPGPHPSHGATGTADLAVAAGIPTKRYYRIDPVSTGRY